MCTVYVGCVRVRIWVRLKPPEYRCVGLFCCMVYLVLGLGFTWLWCVAWFAVFILGVVWLLWLGWFGLVLNLRICFVFFFSFDFVL